MCLPGVSRLKSASVARSADAQSAKAPGELDRLPLRPAPPGAMTKRYRCKPQSSNLRVALETWASEISGLVVLAPLVDQPIQLGVHGVGPGLGARLRHES